MIYKHTSLLALLITTLFASAQVQLPKIPSHDSVNVIKNYGCKLKRTYYKKGKVVLETTYSDPSDTYRSVLFLFSNTSGVDSIYVFIKQNDINIYKFDSKFIIHEQLSYSSRVFSYVHYDRGSGQKTEEGKYHVTRSPIYNAYQSPKYKMGKWLNYKNGNLVRTMNYDTFELDGKTIVFTDSVRAPLNRMKTYTDSLVCATFGKAFFDAHIRFNPDKSMYMPFSEIVMAAQPYGYGLFYEQQAKVARMADMCYDIHVNGLRFDVIMVRVDKDLKITGKLKLSSYLNREFNFCNGLDTTLSSTFNTKAIAFDKIAAKYKMHYPSQKCFLYMEWKHTGGLYGKLTFVMQEEYKYEVKRNGWTSHFNRLTIDPVTGDIKADKSFTGLQSDSSEE